MVQNMAQLNTSFRTTTPSTATTDLDLCDWGILENLNTNDAFNTFHGKLLKIVDTHAPEKRQIYTDKYALREPWYVNQ